MSTLSRFLHGIRAYRWGFALLVCTGASAQTQVYTLDTTQSFQPKFGGFGLCTAGDPAPQISATGETFKVSVKCTNGFSATGTMTISVSSTKLTGEFGLMDPPLKVRLSTNLSYSGGDPTQYPYGGIGVIGDSNFDLHSACSQNFDTSESVSIADCSLPALQTNDPTTGLGPASATVSLNMWYGANLNQEASFIVKLVYNPGSSGGPTQTPDPYPPDAATDHRFVATSGSGLKTACTTASGGPLTITIPVPRVVGAVDGRGALMNQQMLISNHVVSQMAKLRIASFAHNPNQSPSAARSDNVVVNGQASVGAPSGSPISLTGVNDAWQVSDFNISTAALRFGTRNVGAAPTPGQNQIQINIDAGGGGWCTVVDWVSLSFDALYPVIMIHGNGQGEDGKGGMAFDGSILDDGGARLQMPTNFTDSFKLSQAGSPGPIPYDNSISMKSDTTANHGTLLATLIPGLASEFGARHVHLVAHSKGGLDSRDFLARTMPKNFGVLSLITLDTPHQGSAGPDYQLDSIKADAIVSDSSTRVLLSKQVPPNPGTQSLRVSEIAKFNQKNLPLLPRQLMVDGETNTVQYFTFSADASNGTDFLGNTSVEVTGIPGQGNRFDATWQGILRSVYSLTGDVQSTHTVVRNTTIPDPKDPKKTKTIQVLAVAETRFATFQQNDFAVTVGESGIDATNFPLAPTFTAIPTLVQTNHSTVIGPAAAGTTIQMIKKIQPIP